LLGITGYARLRTYHHSTPEKSPDGRILPRRPARHAYFVEVDVDNVSPASCQRHTILSDSLSDHQARAPPRKRHDCRARIGELRHDTGHSPNPHTNATINVLLEPPLLRRRAKFAAWGSTLHTSTPPRSTIATFQGQSPELRATTWVPSGSSISSRGAATRISYHTREASRHGG
jgi:hypothetical protein